MIRVCTSWSPAGYEQYGRAFLRGYRKHWASVPLLVVLEEHQEMRLDTAWELVDLAPLRAQMESDAYKAGDDHNRACYPKFGAKVLALNEAMRAASYEGWLVWLDGDVLVQKPPTKEWWGKVLPDGCEISCLQRTKWDVETGFVGYNLHSERVREFIRAMADLYVSGDVFKLQNWGDGYVFECMLDSYIPAEQVHNLSKGLDRMHVWPHTDLSECLDHAKGPRRKIAHFGKDDQTHPAYLPRNYEIK